MRSSRRCASGRLRATEKSATTGVALAAGAAAQLVVDTPRLVTLGADDVQAADADDVFMLVIALPLKMAEDSNPSRRA